MKRGSREIKGEIRQLKICSVSATIGINDRFSTSTAPVHHPLKGQKTVSNNRTIRERG
jgi:hypothetical protein